MPVPKVTSYLERRNVIAEIPTGDRDEVLKDIVNRLAEAGAIPRDAATTVVRGLLKRERGGSTGVGRGIAIPHTKTPAVSRPLLAFARLSEPVPFGATDGEDVHSLFLVISPPEAAEAHLAILKWVAALARSDYYATILRNTRDPDSLHSLFLEADGAM